MRCLVFLVSFFLTLPVWSLQFRGVFKEKILEFNLDSEKNPFVKGRIIFDSEKIKIPFIKASNFKFSGIFNTQTKSSKFYLEFEDIDLKIIASLFGFTEKELENFNCKVTGSLKLDSNTLEVFLKSKECLIFGDKFKYAQIAGRGDIENFILKDSYLEKPDGTKIFIKGVVNFKKIKDSIRSLHLESESIEFLNNFKLTSYQGRIYFLKKGEKGDLEIWPIFYDDQKNLQSWEFRYKLDESDFLRIRFSNQDTILGFEKRFKF